MVVPFGVGVGKISISLFFHLNVSRTAINQPLCVGDFVVVSKLIYEVALELKKNPESAADYQLQLIELEALDRALKSLERIEPAHHEKRRFEGI